MRNILTAITALGAASLAAGCVIIDAEEDGDDYTTRYAYEVDSDEEALFAASVDADTVTIRAYSGGCTDKTSFEADVDQEDDNVFSVEFEREREDYCRALLPDGVALSYTFRELGIPSGAQVFIANPIGR